MKYNAKCDAHKQCMLQSYLYQQQTLLLCNVKGVFCVQFSTFYFTAYLTHLNKYQPNEPKIHNEKSVKVYII